MVAHRHSCVIGESGDFYFPSANSDAFDVIVTFQSPREKLNSEHKKKAR